VLSALRLPFGCGEPKRGLFRHFATLARRRGSASRHQSDVSGRIGTFERTRVVPNVPSGPVRPTSVLPGWPIVIAPPNIYKAARSAGCRYELGNGSLQPIGEARAAQSCALAARVDGPPATRRRSSIDRRTTAMRECSRLHTGTATNSMVGAMPR